MDKFFIQKYIQIKLVSHYKLSFLDNEIIEDVSIYTKKILDSKEDI